MLFDPRLAVLCDVLGVPRIGTDKEFNQISTDSRTVAPGDVFVALVGEKFDGHAYLEQVRDAGAVAAIVSRPINSTLPQIVVANTLSALAAIAAHNRRNFEGKIIGLTGSAGKTTTKEMIATICTLAGNTLATKGNFNNEIGVPKTLFQLARENVYAVIEMGAAKRGDIAYLTEMVKPDVALVTNAMAAHVEGFGSVENVAYGKGEIYSHSPQQTIAVINADDPYADLWSSFADGRVSIRFALEAGPGVDCYLSALELRAEDSRFCLHTPKGNVDIFLQVPGLHNVRNALAAAAVSVAAGVSPTHVAEGLTSFRAVTGRMQRFQLNGLTLIDDTYNANPGAVKSALDVLARYTGRRLVVLGGMAELGAGSRLLHQQVVDYANEKAIDSVMLYGKTWEGVDLPGNCHYFQDKATLTSAVLSRLDVDAILVKGSRSMQMETVVQSILAARSSSEAR